jgi:hypothetical protein
MIWKNVNHIVLLRVNEQYEVKSSDDVCAVGWKKGILGNVLFATVSPFCQGITSLYVHTYHTIVKSTTIRRTPLLVCSSVYIIVPGTLCRPFGAFLPMDGTSRNTVATMAWSVSLGDTKI